MDPADVEKTVEPQPGPPRTIGTLNIVFGCFLFLSGLTCLGRIGPSFAQNRPFRLDPGDAQNVYTQLHAEALRQVESREAAAQGDVEKRRVKEERRRLEADGKADVEKQLDLTAINRDLLWFSWYFWADFVTGPVLNLLMLAAGIGLTQLRVWARKLAIWVAVIKIVRLVVLTSIFVLVVVPYTGRALQAIAVSKLGEVVIARWNAENAARIGGAPREVFTAQNLVPVLNAYQYIISILVLALGLVYPILTLIILTRPGVKAACSLYEDSVTDSDDSDGS